MTRLLWCDVETTGLDERTGHLLELGLVVTEGPRLEVVDVNSWVIQAPLDAFKDVHPAVLKMHSNNGLMAECYGPDAWPLAFAARDALGWIKKSGAAGSAMAGSSVHFDRRWLREHMLEVHDAFHYRNFDASSLWIMAGLQGAEFPDGEVGHRAVPDIFRSIELALQSFDYGAGWKSVALHCAALRRVLPASDGAPSHDVLIGSLEEACKHWG